MTLVMAWREAEDTVWVVTDSRLTQNGTRLTDHAAKLLEIPVTLNSCHDCDPIWRPDRSTMFGFAYAGSSLVALQAYTAVLPLWSRLYDENRRFPAVGQFAVHLGRFVATYAKGVAGASNRLPDSECCLLGWDEPAGEVQGWTLRPLVRDGEVIVDTMPMDFGPGRITLVGSGAALARERLPEVKVWAREPLRILREQVQADRSLDVGGGVQIGYLNAGGFRLTSDAFPHPESVPGRSVNMHFRGLGYQEMMFVGDAVVTLPSML